MTFKIMPIDFTKRSTKHTRIRSGNGKYFSLMSPLVKIRPPQGWQVMAVVKGHNHIVDAKKPPELVAQVVELYKINGVTVSEKDVWFNCNLEWVSRVSTRHAHTTTRDLQALIVKDVKAIFTRMEDPSPKDWGAHAWKTMGALIASDRYDVELLRGLSVILQSMLDDEFIGCPECSEHFVVARERIDELENAHDAAEWMFNLMNEINVANSRPLVSWKHAVSIHRWEKLTK